MRSHGHFGCCQSYSFNLATDRPTYSGLLRSLPKVPGKFPLPRAPQDKRPASGALHIIALQQCVDHMDADAFGDKLHVASWNNLALTFAKSPFGFQLSIITLNEQPGASCGPTLPDLAPHHAISCQHVLTSSSSCNHGSAVALSSAMHAFSCWQLEDGDLGQQGKNLAGLRDAKTCGRNL